MIILLLVSGCGKGGDAGGGVYDRTQEAGNGVSYVLHEVTLTPRQEFSVVSLDLTVENASPREMAIVPPGVQLNVIDDQGQARPLGLYFQAFQSKPVVGPEQSRRVTIQFMLPFQDLSRELQLSFAGNSVTIKNSGAGAYLRNLPQGEPARFTSPTWGG